MYFNQPRKNKRNITGGDIPMNQIDSNDRVDEEVTQDYEGSLIKVLDLQPEITQIFIESNGSELLEISRMETSSR